MTVAAPSGKEGYRLSFDGGGQMNCLRRLCAADGVHCRSLSPVAAKEARGAEEGFPRQRDRLDGEHRPREVLLPRLNADSRISRRPWRPPGGRARKQALRSSPPHRLPIVVPDRSLPISQTSKVLKGERSGPPRPRNRQSNNDCRQFSVLKLVQ